MFIGLGRVKLLELSQCQNLIVDSSLNCVEFVSLTARLWSWVPLRRFHVRVHEQLVDHCFRLVWVLGDQVQVFHWCGVGMRKCARVVLELSVNVWLFGFVTCQCIVVFPSSRSTNAGETSNHVFRMKAGDPSTVPVVSEMSASLWTCIIT